MKGAGGSAVSCHSFSRPRDASKLKTWPKLYRFHGSVERMRLGMNSRREIFEAHYQYYQQAGKKDKGKILDAVADVMSQNKI
jgi:hypothetical protein